MIRALVALLGRRAFPLREYGPWMFGEHVTVYVNRRWSWRGKKSSFQGHVWFDRLPAYATARWHRGLLRYVKVEFGTLLVCWDRDPVDPFARAWVADPVDADHAGWWGWRSP